MSGGFMKHPNVKLLRAVGMMIGAIVGVGVFGLPYAFSQSGTAIGLVWLLVIGGLLTLLQLMFAEVAIQTPGKSRLVGLTARYLGRHMRWVTIVALSAGIWGAMLAYLIVGGRFLHLLLSPVFGGQELIYPIVIWAIASYLIYRGLQFAAKLEVIVVLVLLFLFIFIIALSLPSIDVAHYAAVLKPDYLLPYGVILFSLAGIGIVPEMADVLGGERKKDLGRAVVIGMSIILLLYGLFALAVVGVTGSETTQTAFDGLIPAFGSSFGVIATLLGSITIISIFMVLGIEMLNTLRFDFKLPHKTAWMVTVGVPLVLFLVGVREFIELVGFIGSVFGGTLGILIALTYWKMRRSPVCVKHHCVNFPAPLTWALITLFAGGVLVEVVPLLLN